MSITLISDIAKGTGIFAETSTINCKKELLDILKTLKPEHVQAVKDYFSDRFEKGRAKDTDGEWFLVREYSGYDGRVITRHASDEIKDLLKNGTDLRKLFDQVRKAILVGASDEYIAENVLAESWVAFSNYLLNDDEFNLHILMHQSEVAGALSTRLLTTKSGVTVLAEENAWLTERYRGEGLSNKLLTQLYKDSSGSDMLMVELDPSSEQACRFADQAGYLLARGKYTQPQFEKGDRNNTHFKLGFRINPHSFDLLEERGLVCEIGGVQHITGALKAEIVEAYAVTFPSFKVGHKALASEGASLARQDKALENSLTTYRSTTWVPLDPIEITISA